MLQTAFDTLSVKRDAQERLMKLPGVHAVGIGPKRIRAEFTDRIAIVVFVDKKVPAKQLSPSEVVPTEIEGIPTDVLERPRLSSREKASIAWEPEATVDDIKSYSPLAGGCRIAAENGTGWGTAGAIVNSSSGKPAILTAKHVVKDTGAVYQPGRYQLPVASVTKTAGYDWAYCELNDGVEWANFILDIGPLHGSYTVKDSDLPYAVRKRGYKTGVSNCKITITEIHGVDAVGQPYSSSMYVEGAAETLRQGDSGAVLVDDEYRLVGMLYDLVSPDGSEATAVSVDILVSDLNISVPVKDSPTLHMVHNGRDGGGCREAINNGTTWLPDQLIHPWDPYGTRFSASICMYKNELFNMRQGSGYNDIWVARYNGAWWDDWKFPPDNYRTTWRPGMAVYNGKLYCIHEGNDYNGEVWCLTYDGKDWSPDVRLAPTDDPGNYYGTSSDPTLVVWQNKLYCFRVSKTENRMWCFTYDGKKWSADQKLAPTNDPDNFYGTTAAPAVVAYRDKLHCIHIGSDSSLTDNIWYFTYDGTTWSNDEKLAPTDDPGNYYRCSYGPAAIVKDDQIYCYHEGSGYSGDIWFFSIRGDGYKSQDICMTPDWFGTAGEVSLAYLPRFAGPFFEGKEINSSNSTSLSPTSCQFGRNIYTFWRANDDSNAIYFSDSDDGKNWAVGRKINDIDSAGDSPASCTFKNQLYVFWKANDSSNRMFFRSSTDGVSFPTGKTINDFDSTSTAPTPCSFKEQLYVFYTSNNDDKKLCVTSSSDGLNWPAGKMINGYDSTSAQLAACAFNDELYVFWQANNSTNVIHYSKSSDGQTWTDSKTISALDSTAGSLGTCVDPVGKRIYIFWKANDPSNMIYFSSSADGTTWRAGEVINCFDSTSAGPTACIYDQDMFIFFKSNDESNRIMFSKERYLADKK